MMTIKIPRTPAPAQKSIEALAASIRSELPTAYLTFIAHHDGAEPEDNCFAVGMDNESAVRSFIPVAEAPALLNEIDGFPQGVIPLAQDDCGNYIYIEPRSGVVFFWDHESEETDLNVADSLEEFLDILKPFDPGSVQLKPGQVQYVWVDPTFKPEF